MRKLIRPLLLMLWDTISFATVIKSSSLKFSNIITQAKSLTINFKQYLAFANRTSSAIIELPKTEALVMEELFTLKDLLLKGDISGALFIVEELEEMSKKDIINNIRSYAIILLLHLIKQQAENRTTRSWDISIRNSVLEIQGLNERPQGNSFYLSVEELKQVVEKAYIQALNKASLEVAEGVYEPRELSRLVNKEEIIDRALNLILSED